MIFEQILYINLSYEIHSLIDSFLYFFLKRTLCTQICLFANEHLPFVKPEYSKNVILCHVHK